MDEYIFPRGALDESVSLRSVKPLYSSFLSHGKNSFRLVKIILRILRSSPRLTEAPSKKPVELGCVYDLQEKSFPKRKRLRSPDAAYSRGGNFWSPTIWRVSTTAYKRQPVLVSSPTNFPVMSPRS